MSKLTITESVKVIPVSESKLRRDMKTGVVSFDVDEKGKKFFDTSELRRVYGELTRPDDPRQVKNSNHPPSETGHDRDTEMLALKDNQIADLKAQLALATERENALISERAKLLDLLAAEKAELLTLAKNLQKQNEVLMLPPPEKKPGGLFQRLAAAMRPG